MRRGVGDLKLRTVSGLVVAMKMRDEARLVALGRGIRLLWSIAVDDDAAGGEALVRAYYQMADGVIALVAATPAADLAGLRVKAEAVAWCCASRTDFALGESSEAMLIGSMLRDLLAA